MRISGSVIGRWPEISPGGWVVGDDTNRTEEQRGEKKEEEEEKKRAFPQLVLFIGRAGETRSKQRSRS